MYRPLQSGWLLRQVAGDAPAEIADILAAGISAQVPGVVHLDLLRHQLIEDPFVDDTESRLHWIGESDWEYTLAFDWQPDGADRHDLVAEGLDTVATIVLNGVEVARTANQHRSYRFDIGRHLRPGRNELLIGLRSPIHHAREQEAVLGRRPHSNPHPFNAMRKSAYGFGWDWGPDLATCGIWRGIGIDAWSGVRIAEVRPLTAVDGGSRSVTVHVGLEWTASGTSGALLRASVAGAVAESAVASGQPAAVLQVTGCAAELWWPRSHGSQPLYPLTVELAGQPAAERWQRRIGFRSVELRLGADRHGSEFSFVINDEPVHIRGFNWIPDDTFLPRVTRESIQRRLTDAVEANANLIRVWGGGIYESEDFYELCDELGLLVWQDFLMACAAYAEDEPLWSEIEAESRQAVARLVAHPSLVVWAGCNENVWGYVDWDWRRQLGGLSWGEGYYLRLFPGVVAELAPGTPYIEATPFSFSRYLHPNDDRHGCMHIWDVWNERDYNHYAHYRPRFVSEFGYQAPPAWSTLLAAVHDEPREPFGPNLLAHQKADDGNLKLQRGLGDHLPVPASFSDWHWTMQLQQARAISFAIHHFRSLAPVNTGAIIWQLNDCWPVISWSAVDSLGHRKPLWYALREVFADRLLLLRPASGDLVLHNDSAERCADRVLVSRLRLDGTVLASQVIEVDAGPRHLVAESLEPAILAPEDPGREFVVACGASTGLRALAYFVEDTSLALASDLTGVAQTTPRGYELELSATGLVKDIFVQADKVDPAASVDGGLITLLPGETVRLQVKAAAGLDPNAFLAPDVLRTANDLVVAQRAAERSCASI